MIERIKSELDCVENSQTKEFAKKEGALYEEQKKFIKKLKSEHDKEVKQIKVQIVSLIFLLKKYSLCRNLSKKWIPVSM